MAFQKFREYLIGQNKMDKVTISGDADTGPDGKKSPKPPTSVTKGKHWKNFQRSEAAQVEDGGDGTKPVDYSAPGMDPGQLRANDEKGGKSPAKGLYTDPLGKKGPSDLIYNPKVWDGRLKMKKLNDTTPEDNKTEQFLAATKGLSTEQVAEYILGQKNAKAVKQILETVEIINNNQLLIETFVREVKRKGCLQQLAESVLDQPEAYQTIAQKLTDGVNARRLQKAVNETTDEPATNDMIKEKPASRNMPGRDDSVNTRGNPVEPAMNVRKAKTVKDVPLGNTNNVMMSKKQYVV